MLYLSFLSLLSTVVFVILTSIGFFVDSTELFTTAWWFGCGSLWWFALSIGTSWHALTAKEVQHEVTRMYALNHNWIVAHVWIFLGSAAFFVCGFEPIWAKYMSLGVALLYAAAILKIELSGRGQQMRWAVETAEGMVEDLFKLSEEEFKQKYEYKDEE